MKAKLFFTCFFLYLSVITGYSAISGKDYIIKPTNDTIFGRIEPMSDIEFRSGVVFYDGDGIRRSFKPGEVSAFYIAGDNRYYETRDIRVDDYMKKVFLRCLVKGEVNLFIYRDHEEANTRFYYERDDYFTELSNTKARKTINGRTYNTYLSEYIMTLKGELVKICPGLLGSVDAVKYNERNLAGFIEKLNQCISPASQSVVFLSTKKIISRSEIVGGIGVDKDWPAKGTSFGIGFCQEIKWPELSRNIFFSYGLELGYGLTTKNTIDQQWSYQKVSVPLNLNIEIRGMKVTPYFQAGVSFIHYFDLSNRSDENPQEGIIGGTVHPPGIGIGLKVKRLNSIVSTNLYETKIKLAWYFN